MGVANIQGATINFNGYKCLQIYGDYNNNQGKIVAYIFDAGLENISLLIFEGLLEELENNLRYAETFSVK